MQTVQIISGHMGTAAITTLHTHDSSTHTTCTLSVLSETWKIRSLDRLESTYSKGSINNYFILERDFQLTIATSTS